MDNNKGIKAKQDKRNRCLPKIEIILMMDVEEELIEDDIMY